MKYSFGPGSGAIDEQTRTCLMHWINEGYRCPVVVTARTGSNYDSVYDGGDVADGADPENLWRHDDLLSEQCRMFAHDFTNQYLTFSDEDGGGNENAASDLSLSEDQQEEPLELLQPGPGDTIVLGYCETDDGEGPWTEVGNHTWESTEVTPSLFGLSGRNSMYNVIHAVAIIECSGHLDDLNAYDHAVLSAGLYHWTLPQVD